MMKRALVIWLLALTIIAYDSRAAGALFPPTFDLYGGEYWFLPLWLPVLNIPVFLCCAFLLGLQVQKHAWQVSYTRKLLALMFYFAPLVLSYVWLRLNSSSFKELIAYSPAALISVNVGMLAFLLCALCLIEPLRRRSSFLATAFAAIDRPEDRPHTVRWLVSSLIATWLAIVAWLVFLPRTEQFLMVALFIAGVGDALAEPVGVRLGRHTYEVRAFGTDRLYTRSWEGSACVFVSAIVGVALLIGLGGAYWSYSSTVLAMVVFSIAATYAEARSPHTWDQPFIIGACAMATLVFRQLVDLL